MIRNTLAAFVIVMGIFIFKCSVFAGPLAQTQGSWWQGYIDVPAGKQYLSVETWCGPGDCDLYVRYGAVPTFISYSSRSNRGDTNLEYLRLSNPSAGRWYIGLYANKTFSNVFLKSRWSGAAYTIFNDMLVRVNEQRSLNGMVALIRNPNLVSAAQRHANDMAAYNFYGHTGHDGSSSYTRITATGYFTGYSSWGYGENVAAGYQNPHYVMRAWLNSPGHRANILNSAYRDFGTGKGYNAGTAYKSFWCQVFGYHHN